MADGADVHGAAFCLQVHAEILKALGIAEPPFELGLQPSAGRISVTLDDSTQTTAVGAPRRLAAFDVTDSTSDAHAMALMIADRLRPSL